jgi:hypothetical protein
MQGEPSEEWEHALWSSLALELLARAALANVRNAAKFENQQELYDFLDLSLDHNKLRRRQKITDFFNTKMDHE